jgi:beta-1,4-mannosyltransferase
VLVTRLVGRERDLAVGDALRALSALDWTGSRGRPGILAYFPCFHRNPYQDLLYSRLGSVGMHAAPMYDAERAARFADAVSDPDLELVVHVHWLNVVTMKAQDEAAARQAAKEFLERLHGMKARGARLLWTVHNILPHDTPYAEVDTELRQAVADAADRIHVMSPRTRELAAPWFELPEQKVFVVPHPSYQGVYPSWMSREQARLLLGIPPGTVVFLIIGAMKPYKGITELLDAFDELSRRQPGRFLLLVAGRPNSDAETDRFQARALTHAAVLAALERIPDDEMQVYLRAADIAVFPYRRSLNSGALALTLTFGLPAVLPAHSGEAAGVDPAYAEIYDAAEPDGLLRALVNAQRLLSSEARAAAAAASERVVPAKVAQLFAATVREWVNDTTSQRG